MWLTIRNFFKGIQLNIRYKYPRVYLRHNDLDGKILLCKVLNEYDSNDEAIKAMAKLGVKSVNEKDLLKEYKEKKREKEGGYL